MINTKRELQFYIMADRIMNGLPPKRTICEKLHLFSSSTMKIVEVLRYMRMMCYYKNKHTPSCFDRLCGIWSAYRYGVLSMRLGFTIGYNVFGYGLVIPHYGTIVINSEARIGNFDVIHTCTCVAGGDKVIGDGFYLSTGCQVVGSIRVGDGVTVAAHSLVNKSFESNVLIAGTPAVVKRTDQPYWYETDRDRERFSKYKEEIEIIKKRIYG